MNSRHYKIDMPLQQCREAVYVAGDLYLSRLPMLIYMVFRFQELFRFKNSSIEVKPAPAVRSIDPRFRDARLVQPYQNFSHGLV